MRLIPLVFLLLIAHPAVAAEADGQAQTVHQPGAAVDPVYKEIAEKTGGRVYDMRRPEDREAFQEEQIAGPARAAKRQQLKENLDITRVSARLPWSDQTRLGIYALLKWLSYSAWCFLGLGLAGVTRGRWGRAAAFGTGRIILGIVFGVAIFSIFASLHWAPQTDGLGLFGWYLAIYVPVRWVEWSIMAAVMRVPKLSWRGGGIIVSCLADGLQIMLFGSLIPIGRFLC